MANYSQDGRPLTVKTPLSADVKSSPLLLVGFSGHEAVSQPFHFQLDLIAENGRENQVVFDAILGKKVTVEMEMPGGKKRPFNGICNRFSQTGRDRVFTAFRMELVPEFWLLTRKAQSRIFQHATVKEILAKVLEGIDANLEGIKDQGVLGHPRDYCVQYRETDFNFACRLMEEEGIYYFFKHDENRHEMILANTMLAHPHPEGNRVLFADGPVTGSSRGDRFVYQWAKVQTLRAGKYTLRDHCFELTAGTKPPFFQNLQAQRPLTPSVKVGQVDHGLRLELKAKGLRSTDDLEMYDYPGEYAQRFDGVSPSGADQSDELEKVFEDNQRTVEIRMQEEATTAVQIQGASDCRQFVAGHKFTLANHFNANGTYLLTEVVHSASFQGYRSGRAAGLSYQNSFACMPAALPFRPPRVTPKPVVMGTQTAVVVGSGAKDEEMLVDKYGRVKVQFHWDRAGAHNRRPEQGTFKYSSCWVRVAQPWAGKNWGAFFWPRIGQEVVVAFLEGDPDQPIIIGSVYNADQRPPYLGDAKTPSADPRHPHDPKLSGIKTNSTLGGKGFNELRFDDTRGKEQVFIHAERDLDTRVKGECRELVAGDRHLIVGWEKDGQKGGDQRELVHKDKHLTVKGNHVEHVEGDVQLLVGGGEGDAGNQDVVIKKTKKERIEKDHHLHVKGKRSEKVGGDQSLTIDGDRDEKVGGSHRLEVKRALEIKADLKVVLEASELLLLQVGDNSIAITKHGIAINGLPQVMINCGGPPLAPLKGAAPNAPEDPKEANPSKPAVADDARTGHKSAPDSNSKE